MLRLINGRPYYYNSVRECGRPRNRYRACGLRAILIARRELAEREEQRRATDAWKAEQTRLDEVEALVGNYSQDVNRVLSLAMESGGYHQIGRHRVWRKRRMKPLDDRYVRAYRAMSKTDRDARRDEYDKLCKLAKTNKLTNDEQNRFQTLMLERAFVSVKGGPGEVLRRSLAVAFLGDGQLIETYFDVWFDKFFAEIAGPTPGPLERMLAFRVVCCWSVVNIFERRCIDSGNNLTPTQSESQQRRVDRAHRRFLSAVKALEEIRRLPAPTLQTINNIAFLQNAATLPATPKSKAIESSPEHS
jgi:hypothetical protein